MSPIRIELREILYNAASWAARQRGLLPLDHRSNPRPDWREYDPIRRFLLAHPPDEATFYGFLSPRFSQKTGLTAAQVHAFVHEAAQEGAEVCTFSPYFDQIGFFLNAFEQGDAVHPGFLDQAQTLLAQVGLGVDLHSLPGSALDTVFCNYWVARGTVWREWLSICEPVHALAEADGPWRDRLNAPLAYRQTSVPFKVFLMERMVCLLLAQGTYRVRAAVLPVQTWADPRLSTVVSEIQVLDALKLAEKEHGNGLYRELFRQRREQLVQTLLQPRHRS